VSSGGRADHLDANSAVLLGSADANSSLLFLNHLPGIRFHVLKQLTKDAETNQIVEALRGTRAGFLLISGDVAISPFKLSSLQNASELWGFRLVLLSTVPDFGAIRFDLIDIRGQAAFLISSPGPSVWHDAIKRLIDIVVGAFALVIVSPIMVGVALAVKLGDGGPIFFRQKRVGQNQKEFTILKFRSMRMGAHGPQAKRQISKAENPVNDVLFKDPTDPRITKVGKFIRSWSLDELPQLFNVMLGAMSLVGPRPPLLSEVQEYESHVFRKFKSKPGITGIWQVSGRSLLSWEESVLLDLYYTENMSLGLDIYILLKTFKVVLLRVGAF
jgi:lipopolysaccharide/colanic/teichoic acid biosynthesis glycosyltransferase